MTSSAKSTDAEKSDVEMAALVALPVSLAELLEVRGRQGLTSRELRAVATQTCRHLATLLESDGHVAAVPLKHITAQTLQLTGSGQVRLSHTELYSDVYSVTAGDIQPVLRSLGEVLLTAAAESVPEELTSVLTNLRDGLVTLQQLPQ
ncbi:uncharacterized protein LOC122376663, partial [Amphibalanus amphitrite]|uniref:uncharacterized protein LOC122376663 n=1 Tax=Amphibalanus amphitrite TaxID=1232801 RepID=UPI001C92347E